LNVFENPKCQGAKCKMFLFSSLGQRAAAWRLLDVDLATSCLPLRCQDDLLELLPDATKPLRPFPSLSGLPSLSPMRIPQSTRAQPPWPSPPITARSLPEPLRVAWEHRHLLLALHVRGIEPRRPEKPPPSPIPSPDLSTTAIDSAAASPPPATSTPSASSR
jgi:hypothetical protein